MRIIFSRKGFDSTAGGCPSPVVDGRPMPLPIPTRQPSCIRYGDLRGVRSRLVADLTGGRLTADSLCHLDPDIDPDLLPRLPGWRGAFGQIAAAASHLRRRNVGSGDLFLFWGSYRPALRFRHAWRFDGPVRHLIYGWLQIGQVHLLGSDGSALAAAQPWMRHHPHVRPGWDAFNTVYVAADKLTVPGLPVSLPGWGVLRRGFMLSVPGEMPSVWKVPAWLHPAAGGCGMTYHPDERWLDDGRVVCAPRGQEFVAAVGADAQVAEWLHQVFD